MNILVADSGSTKTDWLLRDTNHTDFLTLSSPGINPCLMSDEEICHTLTTEVRPALSPRHHPDLLFFYGAGCRPDQTERMKTLLQRSLRVEVKIVASDLLGAARALCGNDPGIVAILGTGSGSAVFDGQQFTEQTPSLGYILGDEGSGAVLGRRLVGDIFKRQLPEHLINAFHARYATSIEDIIRSVYRTPNPNRFLAHFVPFLEEHIQEPAIHQLVVNEFRTFFSHNILPYNRPDLPVNFVGSIAHIYASQLTAAAETYQIKIGNILRSPGKAILDYHTKIFNGR